LTLTDEERTLLWAILTVARDVTEVVFPVTIGATEATEATETTGPVDVTNYSDEFAAAFTPSKVELITAYAYAPRLGLVHHQTPGLVGRSVRSSPALVGK